MKSIQKALLFATVLLLVGLFAMPAFAGFKNGDRVLAMYKDGYWYPATVQQVEGNTYTILYDDGVTVTADGERLKKVDWAGGTKVQCNWQGAWYGAKIEKISGDSIDILYDDGTKEKGKIGKCRQPGTGMQ